MWLTCGFSCHSAFGCIIKLEHWVTSLVNFWLRRAWNSAWDLEILRSWSESMPSLPKHCCHSSEINTFFVPHFDLSLFLTNVEGRTFSAMEINVNVNELHPYGKTFNDSIPSYKSSHTLPFWISPFSGLRTEWMFLSFASPHNSMLSLSWLSGFLSCTCSQSALFLILSAYRCALSTWVSFRGNFHSNAKTQVFCEDFQNEQIGTEVCAI